MTPATAAMTATVTAAGMHTSTNEAVIFWIFGTIAVIAALGMVFSRNTVHGALLLAGDMLCLAVLYAAQDAPFLAFVQVIVYTGAVMMLFLFVLMLVGVDRRETLLETLRGQRLATAVAGLGFAGLLMAGIASAAISNSNGLELTNSNGNVYGLARLIFGRYVFAFEATSALLITAALGAMVLAHRERLTPRPTQRELMQQRFRDGDHPSPLPGPGVYARHNAVDTPALLPDGTVSRLSVPGPIEPNPIGGRELDDDQRPAVAPGEAPR